NVERYWIMQIAEVFAQYMEHLLSGKRCEAREMIEATLDRGICGRKLIQFVIWPAMVQIERLYDEGKINRLLEHIATRINRMIADQIQSHLARGPKNGMRLLVTCGDGEQEELGAQMIGDLFEAEGWGVWLLGAGVPNDEVVELLGRLRPDVLCAYGTKPEGVPGIRRLIDMIREIGAHEQMQIMVVGGVFNRATGLDEEIRADLSASDAAESLKTVMEHPVRIPRPDLPQPGRRRKRKTAKRQTKTAVKSKARKSRPRAMAAAS
ncbi:MAG: cobalamin-dependent protein, partial [Phycisphaerae bacterium]|nr:cobalamin-dependent protein [Phycisphaerae bacterium]